MSVGVAWVWKGLGEYRVGYGWVLAYCWGGFVSGDVKMMVWVC